jgi:hypothetical protein
MGSQEEKLMAPRRTLRLDEEQRRTLEEMRDKHPKAYLRQRAAALLKIAAGASPNHVATHGLHKKIEVDQIYTWLDRYLANGIGGLYIRAGRGRKAAFSPPQPAASAGAVA